MLVVRAALGNVMPAELEFPIGLVYRKMGPGVVQAEVLFYPDLSRLSANRRNANAAVCRNLTKLIPKFPPEELIRFRRATESHVQPFNLLLEPSVSSEAWRDPLFLSFHAVVWTYPQPITEPYSSTQRPVPKPAAVVARVVELGIDVIATAKEDLIPILQTETLAALRRLNLSVSLATLARVQTTLGLDVEWIRLPVRIPSLKDRAIRAESKDEEKLTLLQRIATPIDETGEAAYEIEDQIDELEKALTANPPQSVLLIGPSGVGKTASVRQLARRWRAKPATPPILFTSGSRIVAGQTGFGMWEQRCQDLIKEARQKRVVIHLGSLVELMEVGKSECNHTGIASFLRPAIARGDLVCVAEATPEQLPLIEKQDPQLLDAFRHLTVEEPAAEKGRAIVASFARDFANRITFTPKQSKKRSKRRRLRILAKQKLAESQTLVPAELQQSRSLSAEGLAAIDRLHRRYATYSAYPGRPLRFLDNLMRDGLPGEPVTEEEVYAAFTRETGLPRSVIDPAVPFDLEATHKWFSSRVIGQTDAVNIVADLLATVKAGLTRPNRPIASLLFIGPTGVGKTEMAKELAEFLFGSKDRLTRFDMSEFNDPVAVRRLIGGAFGREGLLTAKVREQPFSVLLLDEVEKADPSFFDLLLQALGEARLTDAGGRLADFRNTVVILTSNPGAESYRRGTTGFVSSSPSASEAVAHFTRAVEQFLRPEMFNRLDRVVPFTPLTASTIRRIADREWEKVLLRDGVRFREVAVTADPQLLDHFAAVGFDPRYGARPLKRAIEKELLAPLARQMNRHRGDTPLTVTVGMAGHVPNIVVRPVQESRSTLNSEPTGPTGKLATSVQILRRWHQLVATSSIVRELENEVYQLTLGESRVYRKQRKKKRVNLTDAQLLARLGRLRELADEVKRQRESAFALEDLTVTAFHDQGELDAECAAKLTLANAEWDKLLLRLYALNAPSSDAVTLALFSEHRIHLSELASAYCAVAKAAGLRVEMVRFDLPGSGTNTTLPPLPSPAPVASTPLSSTDDATIDTTLPPTAWLRDRLFAMHTAPPKLLLTRTALQPDRVADFHSENTIGLALMCTGSGAHVRFWGETGLHAIRTPNDHDTAKPDVLVMTSGDALLAYRPPELATRKGFLKNRELRREYDLTNGTMRDAALSQLWTGFHGHLANWLDPAIAASMRLRLLKLIVE